MQPGTSGGREQVISEVSPEYDSDQFDNEYIAKYCKIVDIPHPMTISKELFYMDEMVARCYEHSVSYTHLTLPTILRV